MIVERVCFISKTQICTATSQHKSNKKRLLHTRLYSPSVIVSLLYLLIPAMSYSPKKITLSTISAGGLNFCVRHGYRCDPSAIITEIPSLPTTTHSLKTIQHFHLLPLTTYSNTIPLSGQTLDSLVSASSMNYSTYTPDLSNSSSLCCLTPFQDGKSHLKVCFALRCFQRLSLPDLAAQLCLWRDNWFTSGLSNPVLSY